MARVVNAKKHCTVNPLKMSQPLGGALAFLGMDNAMPLFHGSQGCTAFGMVLLVRHFRESIPLQTTAMNEATTILGGYENLEEAILTIHKKNNPALIGICSTGLTETKGDDGAGSMKLIRQRHPELAGTALVYASTPDYKGGFQDGYAAACAATIETLVPEGHGARQSGRLNLLPGCHLTPGDVEAIKETAALFGFEVNALPDLAGSLDGHVADQFTPTSLGGTTPEAIAQLGTAVHTIAIGEHMRGPAALLEQRCGVPCTVLPRLTGLLPCDAFIALLSELSGNEVPQRLKRERSRLVDAMLDGHFFFGGKRVAIAAEPDLLLALGHFAAEMGATLHAAVTTSDAPGLESLPIQEVLVGDLADFEQQAAGADLLITHAHGRQAAQRLGIPLFRAGIPIFDRLGAAHAVHVGYRGTTTLLFALANMFLASHDTDHHHESQTPAQETASHACENLATC